MSGALSTHLLRGLSVNVALALACAAGSVGCAWEVNTPAAPSADGRDTIEVPRANAPSWVPPLTEAQTALVAPLARPIKTPAPRVFTDLARFGYATNRPLASDEDAIQFTRMVTKVLDDSPRFYALDELPPGAANTVLQYGPPAAPPDGYLIVRREADGIGQLVAAPGAEDARAAVEEGAMLEQQGKREAALALYRDALARAPQVPALRVALAAAVAKAGRPEQAESLYREAIGVDATFAPAHLGLAELAEQRGDRASARAHLVEALAYHPPSPRGAALLRRLSDRPGAIEGGWTGGWADPPKDAVAPEAHADPFPIFLDVDRAGAVRMAAAKTEAAQIYGGCRALMRFEPAVRSQVFQQPRETPYYLSVAEEVVCLEAGLGAYVAVRDKTEKGGTPGKSAKRDPALDQLVRVAHEDGLSGYAMYEILGQHRPERARTAPGDVHRDIARYLDRWVLSRREPVPEGGYTAAR